MQILDTCFDTCVSDIIVGNRGPFGGSLLPALRSCNALFISLPSQILRGHWFRGAALNGQKVTVILREYIVWCNPVTQK